MRWKYRDLNKHLKSAVDLLGELPWETAHKDSEEKEYRVLRLVNFSREEEQDVKAALDALIINHVHKQMAPYKKARKSEYTPVLKVFNWRSIDNIIKMSRNPDTTMIEVAEAVRRAAAMTCFEKVFPNEDDFLSFQAKLENGEIKDHVNGGIILRLDLSNTTTEGLLDILARSGLDINLIELSYEEGPETIFIPNEAFPNNVRPVTVYDELDDPTVIKRN